MGLIYFFKHKAISLNLRMEKCQRTFLLLTKLWPPRVDPGGHNFVYLMSLSIISRLSSYKWWFTKIHRRLWWPTVRVGCGHNLDIIHEHGPCVPFQHPAVVEKYGSQDAIDQLERGVKMRASRFAPFHKPIFIRDGLLHWHHRMHVFRHFLVIVTMSTSCR